MLVLDANARLVSLHGVPELRTIGVFNESQFSSYVKSVDDGIRSAARGAGYRVVNLCGTLDHRYTRHDLQPVSPNDTKSNFLLEAFGSAHFDGLLFWGAMLNHGADSAVVEQVIRGRAEPCVSLGLPVGEVPSLVPDNVGGISHILRHLIDDHRCRRIVYVAGNDSTDHYEIGARLQGFREAMKAHGLPVEDRLIVLPQHLKSATGPHHDGLRPLFKYLPIGDQVCQVLLDLRALVPGRDFDAVVCRDDWTAIEVLRGFAQRGIEVGAALPVAGFDNTPESVRCFPRLTTIEQDLYGQGRRACEMLIDAIEGRAVPEVVSWPVETLKLRESCGCISAREDWLPQDQEPDSHDLLESCTTLVSSFESGEVYGQLPHQLKKLGIPGCYVVHFLDAAGAVESASLAFGYSDHGLLETQSDWSVFAVKDVLPASCAARVAEKDLVVEVLHFGRNRIGYVVFEVGGNVGDSYYALKSILSAAFQGTKLLDESTDRLQTIQKRTGQLEATLQELREAQDKIVLSENLVILSNLAAGLAHELNSPLAAALSASVSISGVLQRFPLLAGPVELYQDLLDRIKPSSQTPSPAQVRNLARTLVERALPEAEAQAELWAEVGLIGAVDLHDKWGREPSLVEVLTQMVSWTQGRQLAHIIEQAAGKAAAVVESLKHYLDFKPAEPWVEFDVVDDWRHCLSDAGFFELPGLTINLEIETPSPLWGQRRALAQVWTNLIRNAVQAMDAQGTLTLKKHREGDWDHLSFEDTGPGFPEEVRDRVFQPFVSTRTQFGGMGLGLDICRRVVEGHRGHLAFETKPGKTRITVQLPRQQTQRGDGIEG